MWNTLEFPNEQRKQPPQPKSTRFIVSPSTNTTTTTNATNNTSSSDCDFTENVKVSENEHLEIDIAYVQLAPSKIQPNLKCIVVKDSTTFETTHATITSAITTNADNVQVVSIQFKNNNNNNNNNNSNNNNNNNSNNQRDEYPIAMLGEIREKRMQNGFQSKTYQIPPNSGDSVIYYNPTLKQWHTGIVLGTTTALGTKLPSNITTNNKLNSKVTMWQGDITTLNVDAIQNAANSGLWSGGGICGAIFSAACDFELTREIQKKYSNGCEEGSTVITTGCHLHAKHVLHTVGPRGEKPHLLESSYWSALNVALENGCTSVALCCISTGIFGYPPEAAAPLAICTVRKWLMEHEDVEMKIIFCLFLDSDVRLYRYWLNRWFPKEVDVSDDKKSADSNDGKSNSSLGTEGSSNSVDGATKK